MKCLKACVLLSIACMHNAAWPVKMSGEKKIQERLEDIGPGSLDESTGLADKHGSVGGVKRVVAAARIMYVKKEVRSIPFDSNMMRAEVLRRSDNGLRSNL